MKRSVLTVMGAVAVSAVASAETVVTFNGLTAGTVVTNQVPGLTFSVQNPNAGSPDQAIVWDFSARPDLQFAGQQGPPWAGGNVDPNFDLGNGIAIASGGQPTGPGLSLTTPLEKNRPAGDIFIDFDTPVTSFGFTIVDVEGPEEFNTDTGFFIGFLNGSNVVDAIDFADFVTPGAQFYDPTIAFGNGTANRIGVITAAQVGLKQFNRVEVSLGGSAVLAQIRYEAIPTPSAVLGGLGLMGLAALKRRRQMA